MLLALLAMFVLGASWWLVSALSAGGGWTAAAQAHNARVLNQAKQALIGYIAQQATRSGENNPGRLPCPEAAGYYGNPSLEGIAAGGCTLPKVGRLPWRTLGLDKLVDAAGEPLWYAVSPGWAYTSADLTINSNSTGQLTVDGMANDSVALIIAPGRAFAVPASPGCAAWTQSRPASAAPDLRNYLECENASWPPNTNFVTAGPKASFNDQVLRVSAAEILPALEAAIAARIEREVVPVLRTVYGGAEWGFPFALFPNAARFNDGDDNFNPDAYAGSIATRGGGESRGLLPMVRASPCASPVGCPPVDEALVRWSEDRPTVERIGGAHTLFSSECNLVPAGAPTRIECDLEVENETGSVEVRVTRILLNLFNSFRRLDTFHAGSVQLAQTGFVDERCTISWSANADGSAGHRCEGTVAVVHVPGAGERQTVSVRAPAVAVPALLSDHRITESGDTTLGWFVRNRWYELMHYATSLEHAPGGSPPCAAASCLSVAHHSSSPAGNRAILILAGRSLSRAARPNGLLADFLDSEVNRQSNALYEQQRINSAFNDRAIVIDAN